jgi:LPS export ABC transporter protein LptC
MRRHIWLWAIAGAVLFGLITAAYLAGTGKIRSMSDPQVEAADDMQSSYEAQDVVIRQLGDDGTLLYEVAADGVRQQQDGGAIAATGITLHYKPARGQRWTLNADNADLPTTGGTLKLRGAVKVDGQPPGSGDRATLTTESLNYNLATQDITSRGSVLVAWGKMQMQGPGLKANIRTGTLALESVHGRINP